MTILLPNLYVQIEELYQIFIKVSKTRYDNFKVKMKFKRFDIYIEPTQLHKNSEI